MVRQTTVAEKRAQKEKFIEEFGEEKAEQLEKVAAPKLTLEQLEEQELTPEEQGQRFIQKREQLAGKLGISSKEAFKILSEETPEAIGIRTTEAKALEFLRQEKLKEEEEAIKAKREGQPTELQKQIEAGKTPLRRALDQPAGKFGEQAGLEQFLAPAKAFAASAAPIIDSFRSLITGRQTIAVQTAEESFAQARQQVINEIELVRKNQLNPIEARRNIVLARNSLERLETVVKGSGQASLRFWNGGGAQLEEEIIIFNQILVEMESELILAQQEAQRARQLELGQILAGA